MNIDETIAVDSQESEATVAENNNTEAVKQENKTPSYKMDKVNDSLAEAVSSMVINRRNYDATKEAAMRVLATVAVMNQTDEFEVGIRVGTDLFRFEEYRAPSKVWKLLRPAKIALDDLNSAVDFKDRKAYRVSARAESPARFVQDCKVIMKNIRSNAELEQCSRHLFGPLTEEARLAVNGKRVWSRDQEAISYLTIKTDDEADVSVYEWTRMIGLSLFS